MSEIKIITPGYSITEFEEVLRDQLYFVLRSDRDALKALEVKQYEPQTIEEARQLANHPGFLSVEGFLALDDSGDGKVFQFHMECGLSTEQDDQIAVECGKQVKKCLKKMKKEAKRHARYRQNA
jgi:hypothetical protein